jgi:NAD(P)-dependent dehydrogenase (short-subunit alcohol dehydrogenase family)
MNKYIILGASRGLGQALFQEILNQLNKTMLAEADKRITRLFKK